MYVCMWGGVYVYIVCVYCSKLVSTQWHEHMHPIVDSSSRFRRSVIAGRAFLAVSRRTAASSVPDEPTRDPF